MWEARVHSKRDLPALFERVQERRQVTTYALECRLANQIVRGEELRRRLVALDYCLERDLHDLWQACRWADRIELCRDRLSRDKEEIGALWRGIWRRTAGSLVAGEEVTALDAFFFWAKPHLERVLAGEISFAELDAGYDWESGCFKPEFAETHPAEV